MPSSHRPLRLSMLHEEAPEGIGRRIAMNLGQKIYNAMQRTSPPLVAKESTPNKTFANKIADALGLKVVATKNKLKDRKSRYGIYPKGSKFNTGPVMKNPRHRRFFGLDKPQMVGP